MRDGKRLGVLRDGDETVYVYGGLHYIRGNSRPYFSITGTIYDKRGCDVGGGACHDTIERLKPGRFTDLIALHLSDDLGVPMHAAENGWYFARGGMFMFSGAREWHPIDGAKYRTPATEEEIVGKVRRLLRCDRYEALYLRDLGRKSVEQEIEAARVKQSMLLAAAQELAYDKAADPELALAPYVDHKAKFAQFVEACKPRWKREADACIARHGLSVFGDAWKAPTAFDEALKNG